MTGRHLRFLLFLLPLAWATTVMATTPAVPSESGADMDPAAITEPPNITTGGAGTTSGITGADMDEEDEGSGSGQTRGDELFQTPAAATDAGPAYETETPEQSGAGAGESTTVDTSNSTDQGNATNAGNNEGTESEANTADTDSAEQALPDEPLGASDSGRREDGVPQASSGDSDS